MAGNGIRIEGLRASATAAATPPVDALKDVNMVVARVRWWG